jgi:peroxiredoxin Q/BCP
VQAHRKFCTAERLTFDLLADPTGALCRLYDVRVKNLWIVKLAERVTYVIGRDGRIRKVFRKVDPRNHAREVADALS